LYTLTVPFKDYRGNERKEEVAFNLDAREVFKMLPELKSVFEWLESNKETEPRKLGVEEVTSFYTSFEGILLEAWGEMSPDGLHFRKGGKYEFEESALFNACMVMFVTKPDETVKLLEGILPRELFDMVQNADAQQLAAATEAKVSDQEAEIIRLRAELAERDK
jgi:hypothetical protein